MNRFQIITFVILTSFVLSVPLAAIGANASPDNDFLVCVEWLVSNGIIPIE